MLELASKMRGRKGIISIVALGIFAVMMIFAISLQLTVMDTYEDVRNWNNYYAARRLNDSVMGYLRVVLKDHEAGYNTGDVSCEIEGGSVNGGGVRRAYT